MPSKSREIVTESLSGGDRKPMLRMFMRTHADPRAADEELLIGRHPCAIAVLGIASVASEGFRLLVRTHQ
jgi:hypothetical protein